MRRVRRDRRLDHLRGAGRHARGQRRRREPSRRILRHDRHREHGDRPRRAGGLVHRRSVLDHRGIQRRTRRGYTARQVPSLARCQPRVAAQQRRRAPLQRLRLQGKHDWFGRHGHHLQQAGVLRLQVQLRRRRHVRRARRWLLPHDQRRPAVLLPPLAGLHIGGEHGQGHGGFRRGRRARDWPPDGLQPRRLVIRFRRGFLRGERLHHGRGERGRRERLVRLHQDQVQERHLRRQPRVSQRGRDDKVRQRDPRSRRAVRLRRVGLRREGRLLRRRDVPVHRRVRVLRDGRLLLELQGGRRRRRVQSRRELLLRRGGNLRRKRLQVPRRRREAPGNRVRGRQRR
mmetsp:Transcript_5153/g.23758  ORF Transcript_5153/g.23758 Transcript_5153/m.23758 type:complete len:343 (+) Transcript_5153:1033-2061(+)